MPCGRCWRRCRCTSRPNPVAVQVCAEECVCTHVQLRCRGDGAILHGMSGWGRRVVSGWLVSRVTGRQGRCESGLLHDGVCVVSELRLLTGPSACSWPEFDVCPMMCAPLPQQKASDGCDWIAHRLWLKLRTTALFRCHPHSSQMTRPDDCCCCCCNTWHLRVWATSLATHCPKRPDNSEPSAALLLVHTWRYRLLTHSLPQATCMSRGAVT